MTRDDIQPVQSGDYAYRRTVHADPGQRPFIAWDGEGINRQGPNRPQSYVLFGSSASDPITSDTSLHTFELLDYILGVGEANPGAFHVGYAFGYDGNMIVRSLHPKTLERIHKTGSAYLRKDGMRYRIEFLPNKWFSVSRQPVDEKRKSARNKVSVKIFDIFSFFTTSFVKAYEKYVGRIPTSVSEGKNLRGQFNDLEYIRSYWSIEVQLVRELAERLRELLYEAGFRISSWHGPGALASYAFTKHNTIVRKAECPPEVKEAAKYAYAGGRFEMFKLGRTVGKIYSLDINSAYPHGIRLLPDLSTGVWERRSNFQPDAQGKINVARFGVYRIRLLARPGDTFIPRRPGPLFHRDRMGNISFPWVTDGWYWSPEIAAVTRFLPADRYELVEGWELHGATYDAFDWLPETYAQRKAWKLAKIAAEYALKLLLNSLYGKMAQRIGWDEVNRTAPRWHQLEWAGWVTSNTRAMLWSVMQRIPHSELLAVETDGLYTTCDPATLGIVHSGELGGWEIKEYDELLYVQSGLAWLRSGDTWECKRRGLDARTFDLGACRDYLQTLEPHSQWAPYMGATTRFIGLGAALNAKAGVKLRHCVWQTTTREIAPGKGGKRIHVSGQCEACKNNHSAFEAAHDMSIRSLAYADPVSHPHAIPWDNDPEPAWREQQENERWLVT